MFISTTNWLYYMRLLFSCENYDLPFISATGCFGYLFCPAQEAFCSLNHFGKHLTWDSVLIITTRNNKTILLRRASSKLNSIETDKRNKLLTTTSKFSYQNFVSVTLLLIGIFQVTNRIPPNLVTPNWIFETF